MKLIIDRHIPFIAETIQKGWSDVTIVTLEPDEFTNESVRDADVLVVRTRTKINESLLRDSKVQLVCTATIGYDHVDQEYCAKHHIAWVSCPGCNAQAVCDYIEEAIAEIGLNKGKTIGVVGVGHVGTLVAEMAERKGYQVLLNDPPKGIGINLDKIERNCDLITFHTPLTKDGSYPTHHLCDNAFLAQCKPNAIIINAARGGIVDEQALLQSGHPFILDTWENEPIINHEVLQKAFRASYHIAGYSVFGKMNASQMCLDAISSHFGLSVLSIDKNVVSLQSKKGDTSFGWLKRITQQLQSAPTQFEQLRKAYRLR